MAAVGGRFVAADRHDPGQLRAALGAGADLLVDCLCYTAADATALLPLLADAGSAVMLSSGAVYVDAEGNHNNSSEPPRYDGPIRESQATMTPSDEDYQTAEGYGANKVAAEQVLLDSGAPVSVLRAAKVHGTGATRPREWVFVKRALDRRPAILLTEPAGVAQTTAAANIAALIEVVAARPGARILNSADPDAPSVLEISRTIARQLSADWTEVLLDGEAARADEAARAGEAARADRAGAADEALGRTPWDAPHPIVLDMTAAVSLGYVPAGDYAATVAEEVEWLVAAARGGEGAELLPAADDEFAPMLDYAAEDRYLARRSG